MSRQYDYPVDRIAERIGDVFSGWQAKEVVTSRTDRNSFLDNYDLWMEGLRAGPDHPNNFAVSKTGGHFSELPLLWSEFEKDPAEDKMSAKLLYRYLMFVSGTHRNISALRASDADDYLTRRAGPLAVDPETVARSILYNILSGMDRLSEAHISAEQVGEELERTRKFGEAAIYMMCERVGTDFGQQYSRSELEMLFAQSNWLKLATKHVVLSAKIRGGRLEEVPFQHPMNRTDNPGIYFPFSTEAASTPQAATTAS
ncbi:hypothetical protein A3E49_01965 [Candidatus Saccharibacteria bacterium RIFCSPHIGHO2_12_FULL_49_19]|nr:MAG: hypothetical protein A3E49_01965 [Candidatus Saccharibacteria bacterium RIFCSPHIGHO2_12_FULL_49_19]OGL38030.1 MAG: hypothetical protein A3B63_03740 [Candidatus Saccharibacteria bacterium RIFCSPLOWO2_01_FULL_49_22]